MSDLTMLLTMTLITLIVSVESVNTEESLPWLPSMILGMSSIRFSELLSPAVLIVDVAALTTQVICALVKELERVLLPVLFSSELYLNCLALLVEDRLVSNSLTTEEARVLEVEEARVLEVDSSFLAQPAI